MLRVVEGGIDGASQAKNALLSFKISGMNKSVNQMWGCVWVAVVDELWKHRNKKILKSSRIDHMKKNSMVQVKVWS